MSKFVAPRIALLAIAAAFFASACANEATNQSIAGPSAKGDIIVTGTRQQAGNVEVCITPGSPAGDYTVATTVVNTPATGTNVLNTPATITLPGSGCAIVFQRTALTPECFYDGMVHPGQVCDAPQTEVRVVVTPPSGNPTNVDCVLDAGTQTPTECVEPDGGVADASVYANYFHGTQVNFTFAPAASGCTYTLGWWKNKGKAMSAVFDFDGGTDNGLAVLNTPPKGNVYYILAHQYIAASLNSNNGATLTGSALTAYNAATTYFAAASAANPTPGSYTKKQVTDLADILDNFNQGKLALPHCGDEVISVS
jgi:hypothetical protein